MENRAAVFTSNPQAVEVYQAGAWWSGELLGWRHAADGSCQVWVRVVLGGVEETAWTELDTLRLPERHLTMAPEPASAEAAERELSVARHPSSRREHRAEAAVSATAGLPRVRDLSVLSDITAAPSAGRRLAPEAPAAAATGGRRRAPEESAVAPAGGRRRAPETAATAVTGGRRRAPEEAVAPTGGRRRAPEDATSTAPGPAALPERRDAPVPVPAVAAVVPATTAVPVTIAAADATGDPGRHRNADTGLLPAITDGTVTLRDIRRSAGPATAVRSRAVPSAGPFLPPRTVASGSGAWSAPKGLESDLLTRPMRLSDLPNSRRPRLDGARGV